MGNDEIASAASFLAGFDELGPLNLCQTGTVFVFKRFGIPETKVGCFIGDALGCMNLWNCGGLLLSYGLSFCGWTGIKSFIAPILSTVIFCMVGVYLWYIKGIVAQSLMCYAFILYIVAFKDYKQANKNENETKIFIGQYICPVLSSFATFVIFVFDCIIFRICMCDHGNDGVRKYYLFLCISGMAFGFDQSLSAKVIGVKMAYNILGMEAASLLAPVLHWSIKLFSGIFGSHNIDNRILFWHLVIMCAISFAGMFLWMLFIFMHWGDDMYMGTADTSRSAKTSFMRCLSPFFLGILGMGSVFWLYPAICPFMIVNPLHFHNVQLTLALFGTLSNLIPWTLSDSGDVISFFGGSVKGYTKFDVWNYDSWKGKLYHGSWSIVIVLFLLIWISTASIHYPNSFVARCVFQRWPAILCSCLSFFLTLFLKAIGIGGCFNNAIGPFFDVEVFGTFSDDADAKIEISDTNVRFGSQFKFDTGGFKVSFRGRNLEGSAKFGACVILHGCSSDSKPVKSDPISASGASASFQVYDVALTCTDPLTFNGGSGSSGSITSLKYLEIHGLQFNTVGGGPLQIYDFKWRDSVGIAQSSNRYNLSGKTLTGTFTGGTISAEIGSGSITSGRTTYYLSNVTFSSVTISYTGSASKLTAVRPGTVTVRIGSYASGFSTPTISGVNVTVSGAFQEKSGKALKATSISLGSVSGAGGLGFSKITSLKKIEFKGLSVSDLNMGDKTVSYMDITLVFVGGISGNGAPGKEKTFTLDSQNLPSSSSATLYCIDGSTEAGTVCGQFASTSGGSSAVTISPNGIVSITALTFESGSPFTISLPHGVQCTSPTLSGKCKPIITLFGSVNGQADEKKTDPIIGSDINQDLTVGGTEIKNSAAITVASSRTGKAGSFTSSNNRNDKQIDEDCYFGIVFHRF